MNELDDVIRVQRQQEREITELKEMNKSQLETMGKAIDGLNDLTNQLAIQNEQNKFRDKEADQFKADIKELKSGQQKIREEMAANKPFVEMFKSINNRIWIMVLGMVAIAISTAYGTMFGG